jgi:hypothetical protein
MHIVTLSLLSTATTEEQTEKIANSQVLCGHIWHIFKIS